MQIIGLFRMPAASLPPDFFDLAPFPLAVVFPSANFKRTSIEAYKRKIDCFILNLNKTVMNYLCASEIFYENNKELKKCIDKSKVK